MAKTIRDLDKTTGFTNENLMITSLDSTEEAFKISVADLFASSSPITLNQPNVASSSVGTVTSSPGDSQFLQCSDVGDWSSVKIGDTLTTFSGKTVYVIGSNIPNILKIGGTISVTAETFSYTNSTILSFNPTDSEAKTILDYNGNVACYKIASINRHDPNLYNIEFGGSGSVSFPGQPAIRVLCASIDNVFPALAVGEMIDPLSFSYGYRRGDMELPEYAYIPGTGIKIPCDGLWLIRASITGYKSSGNAGEALIRTTIRITRSAVPTDHNQSTKTSVPKTPEGVVSFHTMTAQLLKDDIVNALYYQALNGVVYRNGITGDVLGPTFIELIKIA